MNSNGPSTYMLHIGGEAISGYHQIKIYHGFLFPASSSGRGRGKGFNQGEPHRIRDALCRYGQRKENCCV